MKIPIIKVFPGNLAIGTAYEIKDKQRCILELAMWYVLVEEISEPKELFDFFTITHDCQDRQAVIYDKPVVIPMNK